MPLRELGPRPEKEQKPPLQSISNIESQIKSKAFPSHPTIEKRIKIIETMILPSLESLMSKLTKMKPEIMEMPKSAEIYTKGIRATYDEMCKYTSELIQLKKYNNSIKPRPFLL